MVWQAYWTIATSRPASMAGVAPLSWRDIIAYTEWTEMHRSMADQFFLDISGMDDHYVAAKNREVAARSK